MLIGYNKEDMDDDWRLKGALLIPMNIVEYMGYVRLYFRMALEILGGVIYLLLSNQ